MPVIICWLLFGHSMDIIDVPTRVPSQDLFTIIVIIVPQFAQPVKSTASSWHLACFADFQTSCRIREGDVCDMKHERFFHEIV